MPEEMLVGYLETIARIPNSFQEIVEEYLPGVFEPIREDWLKRERFPDSINPPGPPRWYPMPILVAACILAEVHEASGFQIVCASFVKRRQ